MSDMTPPSILSVAAMEAVCPQTTDGWLYYCDEHDTHGNADSREEAEHMAAAHVDFHEDVARAAGDTDPDLCQVIVWQRTGHERTVR